MKSAEDRIIATIVGGVLLLGTCLTLAVLTFTGRLHIPRFPRGASSDQIKSADLAVASAGSVQDPEARAAIEKGDWNRAIARLDALLASGSSDASVPRALGAALYNAAAQLSNDKSSGPAEWSRAIVDLLRSDQILAGDEENRQLVSHGIASIGLRYYESGSRDEGERRIEEARARHPNDPYICYLLGAIKASEGHYADAQPLLAKGAESSDAAVRSASSEILGRISGDVRAEANFSVAENSRFTMRFEGEPNPALAAKIQTMLASQEGTIASIVGRAPTRKIEVILYTTSQYAQARGLPDWVGGLFDGRIRVGVGDATLGDDRLRQVLAHEYAHAAVFDLLGRSAPGWLDEGVAQLAELGFSPPVDQLRSRVAQAGWVPLGSLTSSFVGMNATQASGAYAESYAASGYIVNRNGVGALQSILSALARNNDPDAAVRAGIGIDLAGLDAATRQYLGL